METAFRWRRVGVLVALAGAAAAPAAETITLTLDQPQVAGISGLRPFWDRPVVLREDGATVPLARGSHLRAPAAIWATDRAWHRHLNYWMPPGRRDDTTPRPGPIVFDAVHRRLLVRFPGAAKRIVARLATDCRLVKAELILPFKGTEKLARGYKEPTSFTGARWDKVTPRWHAVAWALRKPWLADGKIGPTFNAYIHGAGYWRKYGAQDTTHDRYPRRFGPAEVSAVKCEPIDVTALLADRAFGKTPGERLRQLADCGLIVGKWQVYDHRFVNPGYEWSTMIGSRGIFVATPKLVVTLAKAPLAAMQLPPPPVDVRALAERLKKGGAGGEPTARLPSDEQLGELRKAYGFGRPTWMPDWQWQRTRQLYELGGKANVFPATREDYNRWLDGQLATQPRRWEGFSAADQLAVVYRFRKAVPAPVVDHLRLYWHAWLMPHRRTADCVHNQYHQIYTKWRGLGSDYFDRTGDWRGNWSFYRAGYTRMISTMNFNHTAAIGALLGGHFIGSNRAVADGRYGLEHFPLRLWAWHDGTTQESIDHYYLAHTLTAQKMVADFGPTPYDRMMGRSALLKSIEEVAACYHPHLRRFISTSSRTAPGYVLQIQDGVQHIVHTLSPAGALTDLDKVEQRRKRYRGKELNRLPIIGQDLRPRRVAMQAVTAPWAPEWIAEIVDRKKLPFEMTATFRQWGAYRKFPKWKRSYLAANYGLASFDLLTSTVNVMAMWRRTPQAVTSADQLALLGCRYGFNRTNMLDTHKGGTLGVMGGGTAALQHRNRMIVLASPHDKLASRHYKPAKTEIRSLQTTLALLTLQAAPTWQVRVDGRDVTKLPAPVPPGGHVTIRDGVAYVGILPVPATDLGRSAGVLIRAGGEPVEMQGGGRMTEALVVDNYNYRSETPLDQARADWERIDAAYGGFVVEMGDVDEYGSFEAFEKHFRAARLETRWAEEDKTLHLVYRSADQTMELGYRPAQKDRPGQRVSPERYLPYRRVNGKWPYLPAGIERATPLSLQGRAGKLERNGAVLTVEPGRMAHLLTEPVGGTFLAANPLPDATELRFETPGGWRIEADGKLSIARIVARPKANRLWIDYAAGPDQAGPDMATALVVFGATGKLAVTRNGEALAEAPASVQVAAQAAVVVPLRADLDAAAVAKVPARFAARAKARDAALARRDAQPQARLQYENNQEHYILTRPRSGAWAFQRLWPSGTVFRASAAGGLTVASDGRVALLALVLDAAANRIDVTAPRYAQDAASDAMKFDRKAKALLIFGAKARPTVVINEDAYTHKMPTATIDGRKAYVVPLFDATDAQAVEGLPARYREAQAMLAKESSE